MPFSQMFFNSSYAGKLNNKNTSVPWPVPNTQAKHAGRTVLPAVVQTWGKLFNQSAYTKGVEIPDGIHPQLEFK